MSIIPENFGKSGPDLAAYPVIRIDHVPLLSSKLLDTACTDVGDLLSVMHSKAANGETVPKLAYYLQKQMDAMRLEISKRAQHDKSSNRLLEAEGLLSAMPSSSSSRQNQLPPPISLDKNTILNSANTSTSTSARAIDAIGALLDQSSTAPHSARTTEPAQSYQAAQMTLKSSTSESSRKKNKSPFILADGVEFVSAVVKSSSAESSRPRAAQPTAMQPFSIGESSYAPTINSAPSSANASKKRDKHAESLTFRADNSHRAIETINKNFATSFVVAAVEEKKRYLPKKKEPKLSEEELRERERQSRRDAATKRLAARRMAQRQQRPKRHSNKKSSDANSDSGRDSISEDDEDEVYNDTPAPTVEATANAPATLASLRVDVEAANTVPKKIPIATSPINASIKRSTLNDDNRRVAEKKPMSLVLQQEKAAVVKNLRGAAGTAMQPERVDAPKERQKIAADRKNRAEAVVKMAAAVSVANDSSAKIKGKSRSASATKLTAKHVAQEGGPKVVKPSDATTISTPRSTENSNLLVQHNPHMPVRAVLSSEVASMDSPGHKQRKQEEAAQKSGAALQMIRKLKLERQSSLKNVLDTTALSSRPEPSEVITQWDQVTDNNSELFSPREPPLTTKTNVAKSPRCISPRAPSPNFCFESLAENNTAMHDVVQYTLPSPRVTHTPNQPVIHSPAIHTHASIQPLVSNASQDEQEPPSLLMLVNTPDENLDADFYSCSLGPDQLVGLRVWKLVEIAEDGAAQWRVNMREYHEPISNDEVLQLELLHATRSTVRRKVSAGLIALVLGCEALMTGTKQFPTEQGLIAAWQRALVSFDDMASQLSEEHAEKLFDEVWVCGSGHAVCKKLENLVKSQVFAFENALTCFSDAALVAAVSPTERSGVWEVSRTPDRSHGESLESWEEASVEEIGPSRRDAEYMQEIGVERIDEDDVENDDGHYDGMENGHRNDYPSAAIRSMSTNPPFENYCESDGIRDQWGQANENSDDQDDDDDDDGSIIPLYDNSYNNSSMQPQVAHSPMLIGAENWSSRAASAKTSQEVESIQSPRLLAKIAILTGQPHLLTQNVVAPAPPAGTRETSVAFKKSEKIVWKSIFPHFGMIFPISYSASGPSSATPTGNTQKSIASCMEVQSNMYAEWIEVMGDFDTALSSKQRINSNSSNSSALTYRVNSSRSEVYNIVTDALKNETCFATWEELPAGLGLGATWNLLWTWSKPRLNMNELLVWQRVNHFHDSKQLTRKDFLKKNLQKYTDMSSKASGAFEIMPQTFLLPHEYIHFVQAFQEIEVDREAHGVQNYWIMKPVGMSRGRGISIVRDVASLAYSQTSVIQRYVERPLCLNGYKFDLRLFVLVTSFRPLEAFVYNEGFARVSTERYSLDGADMANKFIHLTNSSIQKQNSVGPSKDNPLRTNAAGGAAVCGGSKLTLQGVDGLWARLRQMGIDTDLLWRNIQLCILKSLVVVDEKMVHQPCSFELFGYDVLIDADLRPWLIEVNASPSLARENSVDHQIKNALIRDTIALVDPPAFDRAAAVRIFKRRATEFARNGVKAYARNDPELQKDLDAILLSPPRPYGQDPRQMGLYEKLAPNTKLYEHALKLKGRLFK